jgi:hypothetical protein
MSLEPDPTVVYELLFQIAATAQPVDVGIDITTYPQLLEATHRLSTQHDLVALAGVSHLAYGWMPTMLSFRATAIDPDQVWEHIGQGNLDDELLLSLKRLINNSLVGASKVLHFIKPDAYAIMDSRVRRYLAENLGGTGPWNTPAYYRNYVEWIRALAADPRGPSLKQNLLARQLITGTESILRCIELCFWIEGQD